MARPTNKGLVSKQNLVNIGNAIRTKTGETAPIALTDMPSKILALGTAENPIIATSDSEMATYLADVDKSGMFVQFNGTSTTYVNGEVYRIMDSGDTTQYVPTTDIKVEQEKSITITENGSTSVTPDTGKTLSKVNITTNVPQSGNVTKGLVFSEYDTDGYPHKAEFVGTWSSIPKEYCQNVFGKSNVYKYLTTVAIPNGVTNISSYAFNGCSGLASIEIPDSVTNIEGYAFYSCSSLTSIEIPNSVTNIGTNTFSYCSSLTSIVIPNDITIINPNTFSYCTSLTSIEIPNSVTKIEYYAFISCSSLISLTIPANVSTIGSSALQIGSSSNKATITMKGLFPPTIQSNTFKANSLNKIYVPSDSVTQYKNATNWANFADYIEADPNE